MNAQRGVLATLGALLAIGVGLAALDPGLAEDVPVQAAVDALGNDYFFVAGFGAAALVLVVTTLGGRAVSGLNQATPPRPESVQPAPILGADFDEALDDEVGPRSYLLGGRREQVRDRLREAAIRAEIADSSCSRSTAERRVDAGEWTDDPDARAFLDGSRSPPLGSRVRAALGGRSWFQRGARRTAEVVVDKSGGASR